MTPDDFDGFTINIIHDEDGDWLAHFVELLNVSAFANTPDKALAELLIAWNGVKESYKSRGESLPEAPGRRN